jgi:hypothetical protein
VDVCEEPWELAFGCEIPILFDTKVEIVVLSGCQLQSIFVNYDVRTPTQETSVPMLFSTGTMWLPEFSRQSPCIIRSGAAH